MRFGNIEISSKRFKNITFSSAKKACELFNGAGDPKKGWRLPTEIEMAGLFDFLESLGTDRRVGDFGKLNKVRMIPYWTSEGSVIDLQGGGIYNIDTSNVEISAIMVRDI